MDQALKDDQMGYGFLNTAMEEVPYQKKIEAAKRWLGDKYLLVDKTDALRRAQREASLLR